MERAAHRTEAPWASVACKRRESAGVLLRFLNSSRLRNIDRIWTRAIPLKPNLMLNRTKLHSKIRSRRGKLESLKTRGKGFLWLPLGISLARTDWAIWFRSSGMMFHSPMWATTQIISSRTLLCKARKERCSFRRWMRTLLQENPIYTDHHSEEALRSQITIAIMGRERPTIWGRVSTITPTPLLKTDKL
jgi:hypothetical protein